jgi:hypothetical protein
MREREGVGYGGEEGWRKQLDLTNFYSKLDKYIMDRSEA